VLANGWMEGLTVAAIVMGGGVSMILINPAIALPMLQWWDVPFISTGIDTAPELAICIIGLIYIVAAMFNLYIPRVAIDHKPLSRNPVFLFKEFSHCFWLLWKDPLGQVSLAVTTLFWGAGATLRLIVLAWAAVALNYSTSQAIMLTVYVALGIAIGSVIAGKFVKITNAVKVIDPRTNTVVDTLPTGQKESHMLALSGDGRTAYTSNVGAGTVSVIDVATKKVTAMVTVAARAQRIALSPDGRFVFTADQDAPRLAVIDTKTNKLAPGVALPGVAYGTAPTPDGRFLIMALPGLNQVGVLDLKSMEVVRTLDVPKAPQEVLVRPDGRVAYVSCDASGQVAVIDLVAWKVERLIPAGPMADGLAWAAQP
jgi:YVTN family beta-propeller protein